MKKYDIDGLQDHNKYTHFIDYMFGISDAFSLVFFRYKEDEKYSPTAARIKEKLERFKIYEKPTCAWGGTVTFDTRHEYLYSLYRCDIGAREILLSADNLFEWDYEKYPMDLCFFKEGYSFFSSTVHEHRAVLCTDDEKAIEDLTQLGIECNPLPDTNGKMFFDQFAIPPFAYSEIYPRSRVSDNQNDTFKDIFDPLPLETDLFSLYLERNSLIFEEKYTAKKFVIANIVETESVAERIAYYGKTIYLSLFDGEINTDLIDSDKDSSAGIWVAEVSPLSVRRLCFGTFRNIALLDNYILSVDNENAKTINIDTGEINIIQ